MPDRTTPKVMIETYNNVKGLPIGRYQQGSVVVYSSEWGADDIAQAQLAVLANFRVGDTGLLSVISDAQHSQATSALECLKAALAADLPTVEMVYVYVGLSAMKSAMAFIRQLKAAGKEVVMVACDCDYDEKKRFAQELGIKIVWDGICGGSNACRTVFDRHVHPGT